MSAKIIARGKWNGHDIEAEVINPGGWFGKTWLIGIGVGYSMVYYAVEADSVTDAINEFSESSHGHHIHIAAEDLNDYKSGETEDGPDYDVYFDDCGRPCDLEHLMIYGKEVWAIDQPWPCRYFAADGTRWPRSGVSPLRDSIVAELVG